MHEDSAVEKRMLINLGANNEEDGALYTNKQTNKRSGLDCTH